MLRIKIPPAHNFSVFIDLAKNIPEKWMLGRMDKKGNFILNEIECEIDDVQAIIELHDYKKLPFNQLALITFDLKLIYGFDSDEFKKILFKKYKSEINQETEIAIILYKLIETA